MQNTNDELNQQLSSYEIEQPVASLLQYYTSDLGARKRNGFKIEREYAVSRNSQNALEEIEQWSRAIGFLIWKVSTCDDTCENTVDAMGIAGEILASFAVMAGTLGELENNDNTIEQSLSSFEIEQPIASLLLDYADSLATRESNGEKIEREYAVSKSSRNALE